MGLRDGMLALPIEQRLSYDPALRLLYVDFRQLSIGTQDDIDRIRTEVERRVAPLGHKVHAIVYYVNFTIYPDIVEAYSAMVRDLSVRF